MRWGSLRWAVAGLLIFFAGAAAYHLIAQDDLPTRASDRLAGMLVEQGDVRTGAWEPITTAFEQVQIARVAIAPAGVQLAAIDEVGDAIVFASRHGRFFYLTDAGEMRPLELGLPMNLASLQESGLLNDVAFDLARFRVTDLLAEETGPGRYDLFVAYHRFAGACINVVVSRIALEMRGGALEAASPWRDVYVARPCVPLDMNAAPRFAGHQGGGRLARRDADTLLLSVGDFKFDGVTKPQAVSADRSSDLGKLLAISLSTGRARIVAMGLRSPEGLLVTRDGRVWETEHGPQGGDEVNLILDGGDYGWPIVTYGVQYGYPQRVWPSNPTPGSHDGYVRPAFAFVPSIGVSNIIQPSTTAFPNWQRHLLVGSLRAQKLYVLGIDGDDIVYAEPIQMDERIRDLISLHDGRIAMITDQGRFILMRPAQEDSAPLRISGFSHLPDPTPEERAILASSPVQQGSDVFATTCNSCHSLSGEMGVGPPLNGLIGRRIGGVEGYGYSEALASQRGVWTPQLLKAFLRDPQRRFRGTTMASQDLSPDRLNDVVAYLTREQNRREKNPN